MLYDENLAKRFVKDCKLPIQMVKEDYFFYYLNLYEEDYGSMTKYRELVKVIEERFDGDCQKFLDEYYSVRDRLILTVTGSEAFKRFNNCDMTEYSVKNKPNVTSNSIYNINNVGKFYMSVDLKKANFQALKNVDKDIVLGCDTYDEFVGKFTDLEYIKTSKYFREVVFGQMNPKRHITVEKYFITKIYRKLIDILPYFSDCCVCLSNDEIIFEIPFLKFNDKLRCFTYRRDIERIAQSVGFEVSVEFFHLNVYILQYSKSNTEPRFFVKDYFATDGKFRLISAPLPYHAIIYKLYKGLALEETDYHFNHDGMDARLCEKYSIIDVSTWLKES